MTNGMDHLDGYRAGAVARRKTHVLTDALHYGSGVFEGARIYGGEVFASTQHSERLRASANIIGFEVPYTAEQLMRSLPRRYRGAGAGGGLYPAHRLSRRGGNGGRGEKHQY